MFNPIFDAGGDSKRASDRDVKISEIHKMISDLRTKMELMHASIKKPLEENQGTDEEQYFG